MSRFVTSVLIRSTMGMSEPRYAHVSQFLENLGYQSRHINWARSSADEQISIDLDRSLFNVAAPYGAGFSNYFNHLRFNSFVFRKLWGIRPQIIYACDFDTFLPSFIYTLFHPAILIFDQFDPLSARVSNRLQRNVIDFLEMYLSNKANVRITPNLQRIPMHLRGNWIEVKNLFPFESHEENQRVQRDGFKLIYGGVLSYDRGLIECANIVKTRELWSLDIFGQGPLRINLEKIAGGNIGIHNQVPHEELMNYAQTADLYLALYDPSNVNNRLTASNKLYEAAQLGVPLLTSKGTYLGEIVQKFDLGWSVTYGDSEEIERVFDEFASLTQIQKAVIVDNLSRFFQDEVREQNASFLLLENRLISMVKTGAK
jgi:glycosyltransferase involved in cell wall biosynthesis